MSSVVFSPLKLFFTRNENFILLNDVMLPGVHPQVERPSGVRSNL